MKYWSVLLRFISLGVSNTVVKVKVTASGDVAPTHSQPSTGRWWVVCTTFRPLYLFPLGDAQFQLYRRLGGGAGKSHLTWIRSPDRLAHSQSL
jgi:hypothetical protein